MSTKLKKILFTAGSIIFWILLWHIAATKANKELLYDIPLPLQTFKELINCIKLSEFWEAVLNSLSHICIGFIFAVIFGLICGILSGNSLFFKTLTGPVARLLRSVPVAALIILGWLWIPSETMPSFIVFVMVLPIIWLQIETALLSIDYRLIEMAKTMGMSNFDIVKNIKFPTILPAFRESAITGLGFAWKSGVAAEVLCNPTGSLGAMLSNAKANIEYARVFAIIAMIILLSVIMENIIKLLWKERRYD